MNVACCSLVIADGTVAVMSQDLYRKVCGPSVGTQRIQREIRVTVPTRPNR